MRNKFDKPLDQWIEEPKEIEYETYVVKDGKPQKERVKETVYEKVKYLDAPTKKFTCAPGQHDYFMFDRVRHVAKCNKCPKHKFLFASSQTIRKGKIMDRLTGQVFD
jgi:hypothetical protein